MTKAELLKALSPMPDDCIVVCADETGGWDNIEDVTIDETLTLITIHFGGGSPFSDE